MGKVLDNQGRALDVDNDAFGSAGSAIDYTGSGDLYLHGVGPRAEQWRCSVCEPRALGAHNGQTGAIAAGERFAGQNGDLKAAGAGKQPGPAYTGSSAAYVGAAPWIH